MGNIKRRRPNRDPDPYKVGRGNPPKHTQFRPGQSGNPAGRPKGARNFETIVKGILKRQVKVTSQGKSRKVSMVEATLLRLCEKVAAGELRAISLFLAIAQAHLDKDTTTMIDLLADDHEILQIFKRRVLDGAAADSETIGANAATDVDGGEASNGDNANKSPTSDIPVSRQTINSGK